jgi:hypothetical protein
MSDHRLLMSGAVPSCRLLFSLRVAAPASCGVGGLNGSMQHHLRSIDDPQTKNLLLLPLLTATGVVCATGVGYDPRGEKSFQNEIDSHVCEQLYVNDRAVDWVVDVVSTSVGLIGKIGKQEPAPYGEAVAPSATYGGTLKGWFIFDLADGRRKPVNLPGLSDFSKPSFALGSPLIGVQPMAVTARQLPLLTNAMSGPRKVSPSRIRTCFYHAAI